MKPTLKQWLQVAKNFIIEIPLEILAFFVVPIALLFAKESDDHLLRCFRWFEDADDFYDGQSAAINGDGGWRRDHFPPPKNRTYFARLCWLLRNRIGYFSVKYLGVKVLDVQPSSVVTHGDVLITQNKGRKSGFCRVECRLKDGRERFGYYREIRYTGFLSGFYCRIYVGWKLMDIAGANPENWHEFIESEDKKVLKTVWAFHPLKRVKK
nr:hypothetical protein [uncultured Campylobacter sp.]